MQKYIIAGGVLIIGVAMIVIVFANDLFTVAPAFEELTDEFSATVMQADKITTAKGDIVALEAVEVEFGEVIVPTLAGAMGMDAASFTAFVGEEYTAVATGVAALPQVTEQFNGVMELMSSQLDNFEQADAIPTSDLPATTLPWIIVLIGISAIIVGIVLFFSFRLGAILAIVLGVVVVASSVLLNLVDKAGAADDMNEAFKPAYTQELVTGSEEALVVVGAMGQQMSSEMLPALAQQLGMSEEELGQFMAANFPATAQAMQEFEPTMERFTVMVVTFDSQLENYNTIKDTVLQPIAWAVLIGGALILILGAWGFIASGKDETAPA